MVETQIRNQPKLMAVFFTSNPEVGRGQGRDFMQNSETDRKQEPACRLYRINKQGQGIVSGLYQK